MMRRLRQDRSGASALEFALVAPVLVMLIFGIIEAGRLLYAQHAMGYAVSKAARQAMIHPDYTAEDARALASKHMSLFNTDGLVVTMSDETLNGNEYRRIEMSYPYHSSAPLLGAIEIDIRTAGRAPKPL